MSRFFELVVIVGGLGFLQPAHAACNPHKDFCIGHRVVTSDLGFDGLPVFGTVGIDPQDEGTSDKDLVVITNSKDGPLPLVPEETGHAEKGSCSIRGHFCIGDTVYFKAMGPGKIVGIFSHDTVGVLYSNNKQKFFLEKPSELSRALRPPYAIHAVEAERESPSTPLIWTA